MFPAMYLFTHEVISSYFLLASSFVKTCSSLTRNSEFPWTFQSRFISKDTSSMGIGDES